MSELNGNTAPAPGPTQMNLKRNIIPIPAGLKAVYNLTDGTFIAEVNIYAVGTAGQQSIPAVIADLAKALNSPLVRPTPEEAALLSKT